MPKLILFNMMTIDGFFEGANEELDWHHVDPEFNEFAIGQLDSASALIFGRKTYELMAGYWPTPDGIKDDPDVADRMNSIPKMVFSGTLHQAGWTNTKLIKSIVKEEIENLKQQSGKDIFILGSANLATTFRQLGLIDEYRVMVNPIILGKGNPLFPLSDKRESLVLTKTRPFRNGNVLLIYSTIPAGLNL